MENKQFTLSAVGSLPRPKVIEKIVERIVVVPQQGPVLIELNQKRFKALVIVSNAIPALGIGLFFSTFSELGEKLMSHETGFTIAILSVVIGMGTYVVAKFLMWWNNG